MSTSTSPVVVLKPPKRNHSLILYAAAVAVAMDNNLYFPNPPVPIASFAADVQALHDAEVSGPKAERNARKQRVLYVLRLLRAYVQSVAEVQPNPAEARAVIVSAAMLVKKPSTYNKPVLEARRGEVSGAVTLLAKAVARSATYYWQYSENGVDWIDLPDTMKATTSLSGLTPLHTYHFRFRTMTRRGESDFGQSVSLIVL